MAVTCTVVVEVTWTKVVVTSAAACTKRTDSRTSSHRGLAADMIAIDARPHGLLAQVLRMIEVSRCLSRYAAATWSGSVALSGIVDVSQQEGHASLTAGGSLLFYTAPLCASLRYVTAWDKAGSHPAPADAVYDWSEATALFLPHFASFQKVHLENVRWLREICRQHEFPDHRMELLSRSSFISIFSRPDGDAHITSPRAPPSSVLPECRLDCRKRSYLYRPESTSAAARRIVTRAVTFFGSITRTEMVSEESVQDVRPASEA